MADPVKVRIVPPQGLRLELIITDVRLKGMFLRVAPEATGIIPLSSVTIGDQLLPATGITVQVI